MLKSTEILFAHGELLSVQMLNELAARPNELVAAFYATFDDGIISGLDFQSAATGDIILTAGVVKWQGRIYTATSAVNITELLRNAPDGFNGTNQFEKWRLELVPDVSKIGAINHHQLKLRVRSCKETVDDNCMVLMIFRWFGGNLKTGQIKLPCLNLDAENPLEEFYGNALAYLLDTPYLAMNGKAALAPLLCRAIADLLRFKSDKDAADLSLLMSLNNFPVVSWQAISDYVMSCGETADLATREKLLAETERCLLQTRYVTVHNSEQTASEKTKRRKDYDSLIVPYHNLE